jgi:group I intron endonuclease
MSTNTILSNPFLYKKVCGIYKILTSDNQYYIGSSKNCSQRIRYHIHDLVRDIHCNPKLQRKFNKATNVWQVILIEECLEENLLNREQYYLDESLGDLNCLNCNFDTTKPLPRKGKPLTAEQKLKISLATKGKKRGPLSEEHRRSISESRKGIKFTEEHKQNLKRAAVRPKELRDRISSKLKGRKINPLVVRKRLLTRYMKGLDKRFVLTQDQIRELLQSNTLDVVSQNFLLSIRNSV